MTINAKHGFTVLTAAVFLSLSGCSAHNPFNITNTTDSSPVSQSQYPVHHNKVFITEQSPPAGVDFELLSTIDVGKIWYGSSKDVLVSMADRARELGANGVVQAKTWMQPSGFSWAAPHGSGQAVRVSDIKALESLGIKGSWY
jgi:hypothetical protein